MNTKAIQKQNEKNDFLDSDYKKHTKTKRKQRFSGFTESSAETYKESSKVSYRESFKKESCKESSRGSFKESLRESLMGSCQVSGKVTRPYEIRIRKTPGPDGGCQELPGRVGSCPDGSFH